MTQEVVVITDKTTGKTIECPVLRGTVLYGTGNDKVEGPPVIDTSKLYKELGMFTIDPGFMTTASCRSAITYLDGDKGVLMHRGYPIEQLAQNSTYLEVAYLLIYGELPTQAQMAEFEGAIKHHSMVHEHLTRFFSGYRYDAHPMAMMVGVMGAMASYYHDETDKIYKGPSEDRERILDITARRVLAKIPTLASRCYKYGIGHPFVYPLNTLTYVENFMNMMFAKPAEPYEPNPTAARALDLLFILHADHEQNASTSAVRLASSACSNAYSSIAAGIATLWGSAHGGANEEVVKMLEEIKDPKNIRKFVDRAKDKNDPFRLMGFGHRVYKNFDPRATIIRKACHDMLDAMGGTAQRPLFEIAMELERIALEDEYFIERKLYPNVDFYSGIILSALDIPTRMFTVLFALARSAGWLAQWREMVGDNDFKIGRPRQLYIGSDRRDYIPMNQR